MAIVIIAVLVVAAAFVGCKFIRGQILDGPGMERDPKDYPEEEPVDKKKSKADKSKRKSLSADARNFSKSITEWLTRNFTEDGLNE